MLIMKQVCIVFSAKQYLAWQDNGILDNLKKKFELEVVFLNSSDNFGSVTNFYYGPPLRVTEKLYSINQVANRRNSKTFGERFRRLYFGSIDFSSPRISGLKRIVALVHTVRSFVGYSRINPIQTISFIPFVNLILHIYLRSKFNKNLKRVSLSDRNFVKNIKSDFVIYPSTGAEVVIFELIELTRLEKKSSIMVIENWDNLTSKTTFLFKPDFLTVMGQKSIQQANVIHGINKIHIIDTGLPKFENLVQERSVELTTRLGHERINFLYLGYSLPYNEEDMVNCIYLHLSRVLKQENFKLTYRPHPFRQKRVFSSDISIQSCDNFAIDRVTTVKYPGIARLPSIDRDYVEYLKSFDFIVTTPTTMVFEIMLLGIPCLVDGGFDGIHRTSPFHTLNNYLHQEDLSQIPELRIANSQNDLTSLIDSYLQNPKTNIDYTLENLVELNSKFSARLTEFLTTL